jgi:hypothetical protein
MNFTNKHIVLIILIIIIVVFIMNYDVYVVPKNEPLCKPVFVVKREISPEMRAKLNKTEKVVYHEAIDNIATHNMYEGFENTDLKLPDKSICYFSIPEMKNADKIQTIDSVLNIIAYIPTPLKDEDIKEIIKYFGSIYDKADSIDTFYNKVESETKKSKDSLMTCRFAKLILFLIGKCELENLNKKNKLDQSGIDYEVDESIQSEEIPKKVIDMVQKKIKKKLKKMEGQQIDDQSKIPIDTSSNLDSKPNFNYTTEFDVEQIKSIGGFNLNDGPSSYEMSDPVDRTTKSTRIGPYHHKELIYNDGTGKQNNTFYVSNFKNQSDAYTQKAKEYMKHETCASDYFNTGLQAYNLF